MGLMTEPKRIVTKTMIDWSEMTDDELQLIETECCICHKPIITYKAFEKDALCSKHCANKAYKKHLTHW